MSRPAAALLCLTAFAPLGFADVADARQRVPRDALLGRWESPAGPFGMRCWFELKPDGSFVYEDVDPSVGWRTKVTGTWKITGGRVVLSQRCREHDGQAVKVRDAKEEAFFAVPAGRGWELTTGPGRPGLRKTEKGR